MSPYLPDTVLLEIFSLACTDTGKTGCALSAVSRHIGNISAEYRFQSIAITSATQLHALCSTLHDLDDHSKTVYRIRHLYLRPAIDNETPFSRPDLGTFIQVVDAMSYILHRAAPSLETLCLLDGGTRLYSASNTDALNTFAENINRIMDHILVNGDFTFPCLTELTIFGPLIFPVRKSDFAPKLRRLHISYDVVKSTEQLAHSIASTSPQLTHLRLSCMPPIGGDETIFLLELALAMGVDFSPVNVRWDNPDIMEHMSPPPLSRHLLIEQTQDSIRFTSSAHITSGNTNVPYSILRRVHEHCSPFFTLLPLREAYNRNASEELKEDWLGRIQGMAGCWVTSLRI